MTCDFIDRDTDGEYYGVRCGDEDVIQFTIWNPMYVKHGDDYNGTEPQTLEVQLCQDHLKHKKKVTWKMAIASHTILIDEEKRGIR